MKEKETIIVVCQPEFQLSKAALDYLSPDNQKESMIILMLENAEIALSHGNKNKVNKVIKSNVSKSKTEKIFLASKYDNCNLTEKEHNSIFRQSLVELSKSYPNINIEGFLLNTLTGSLNVFK
ncbi:MAG: hypothetical protein NE328_01335 [Lentisphaeraceae bacterium]|nr:hypothetical protein [Lentisphaeraceae bacterium]